MCIMTKQLQQSIRAVADEFIRRKYNQFSLVAIVGGAILFMLAAYLTSLSAWWLLLTLPVMMVTVIMWIVLIVVFVLMSRLRLGLRSSQKKAVRDFVDKLERVAESVQTPVPLLVVRMVWDALQRGENQHRYIRSIVEDSTSLQSDFESLQKKF